MSVHAYKLVPGESAAVVCLQSRRRSRSNAFHLARFAIMDNLAVPTHLSLEARRLGLLEQLVLRLRE